MRRRLVDIYRTADDYRRYTSENPERRRAMESFYSVYRRHIGRRVLDLCCGGGVLGRVLEQHRREYIGVDANPDNDPRSAQSSPRGRIEAAVRAW